MSIGGGRASIPCQDRLSRGVGLERSSGGRASWRKRARRSPKPRRLSPTPGPPHFRRRHGVGEQLRDRRFGAGAGGGPRGPSDRRRKECRGVRRRNRKEPRARCDARTCGPRPVTRRDPRAFPFCDGHLHYIRLLRVFMAGSTGLLPLPDGPLLGAPVALPSVEDVLGPPRPTVRPSAAEVREAHEGHRPPEALHVPVTGFPLVSPRRTVVTRDDRDLDVARHKERPPATGGSSLAPGALGKYLAVCGGHRRGSRNRGRGGRTEGGAAQVGTAPSVVMGKEFLRRRHRPPLASGRIKRAGEVPKCKWRANPTGRY